MHRIKHICIAKIIVPFFFPLANSNGHVSSNGFNSVQILCVTFRRDLAKYIESPYSKERDRDRISFYFDINMYLFICIISFTICYHYLILVFLLIYARRNRIIHACFSSFDMSLFHGNIAVY